MIFFQYPPLHLCLGLILGILSGFYMKEIFSTGPWLFACLLVPLALIHFLRSGSPGFQPFFTATFHLFMFFFGIFLVGRELPGSRPGHFQNHLSEEACLQLELRRELKANGPWKRFEAEVTGVDDLSTSGSIYLTLARSSLTDTLGIDDVLLTCNQPQEIQWSGNPGSFDFKSYAEKRGIGQRIYCEDKSFAYLGSARTSFYSLLRVWNQKCRKKLDSFGLDEANCSLLKALILGDRTGMPEELTDGFRRAGAAHVLALSGLHVGIIIGLLHLFLKPLRRLGLHLWVLSILELALLWSFGIFTGSSSSVLRAIGMYSIYAIGKNISRDLTGGRVIVLTLFLMLLFRPLYLFDVGFQLSFLALAGISLLYPGLRNLWLPRHRISRYFVQMAYVSAGAQLGVLPLILLYFNQFSGHFMLSSLVLVPLMAVLIPYGVGVLAYSFVLPVPEPFLQGLEFIMGVMNAYVEWISGFHALQWERIYFHESLAVLLYSVLLVFFLLVRRPGIKLTCVFMGLVLVFETFIVWERRESRSSEELFVAQLRGESLVTFRSGERLCRLGTDVAASGKAERVLHDYLDTFPTGVDVYARGQEELFCSKRLLIRLVGRDHLVLEDGFKTHVAVLSDSPRIHLGKLIEMYEPEVIVADGSNYPSFVRRWRKTCESYGILFHDTADSGAFVYRPS